MTVADDVPPSGLLVLRFRSRAACATFHRRGAHQKTDITRKEELSTEFKDPLLGFRQSDGSRRCDKTGTTNFHECVKRGGLRLVQTTILLDGSRARYIILY